MSTFRALLMGEGTLPPEYTRVNWIQSSRTQYFDLDLMSANGIHKVEVDMLLPLATNSSTSVFGSRSDAGGAKRFGTMYFNQAMSNGIWIGATSGLLSQSYVQNQRFNYSVEVDEPSQSVTTNYNGLVRTAIFSGSSITGLPLYLFGANLNGNITERGTFRVFGVKVWVDKILVRDMLPVTDRFNEPMMFDNVTGQAFKNKGTGTFAWN